MIEIKPKRGLTHRILMGLGKGLELYPGHSDLLTFSGFNKIENKFEGLHFLHIFAVS